MTQGSVDIATIVWTDPARLPLVQDVLGRMKGVQLVAVGGPRKVNLTELAESYGAKAVDDFRAIVRQHAAKFLLLATSQGVTRADLQQARAAGMQVIAIEPPLMELAPLEPGLPEVLITAPWFRLSRSWLSAAEPQQALGQIRGMHLTQLAPPEAGSLYARLYDALDTLVHFRGVPESIDAALTGPLTQPPDDLRALTGHLTAHLRFGSDASATLLVSDRAAAWHRRLIALGSEGQLTLEDSGYRLITREGKELDSLAAHDAAPPDPAEMIAAQWQRHIDNPAALPASDALAVIACCQAALLSCRTGEHESPAKLLHMQRG
jgi:predicted dehydrogenase